MKTMKTLIIDNFDSFTYNIFQCVAELGGNPVVFRNDAIGLKEIVDGNYSHIILSPGPGSPDNVKDFGICGSVIQELSGALPILGICLGHQGIISFFGGKIERASEPMHGKMSEVSVNPEHVLFKHFSQKIRVMRYHSLIGRRSDLPDCLRIISETDDGIIMGIEHRNFPTYGVQFHPESIGTPDGKQILQNFLNVKIVTRLDMEKKFDGMIDNGNSEEEMTDFLVEMAERGETIEEITGAVLSLRKHAGIFESLGSENVMDTCGTGGSGLSRMNISTTAAFVLAAAGVKIAKHGNKASSGRCGSFDLLEELGVNIALSAQQVSKCIEMFGIGFLYAPLFHPAFKIFAPVRKKIQSKTIFNLVGPLVNPASPSCHLLGTTSIEVAEKLIHVMRNLGYKRAMVVVGENGLDEVTAHGKTFCYELKDENVKSFSFSPEEIGLFVPDEKGDVGVGSKEQNADIFLELLQGVAPVSMQNLLEVNCAFGLYVAGKVETLQEGLVLTRRIISSKRALDLFKEYRRFSNQLSPIL